MPIIQRPYVPPDDEIPKDENFATPGSLNAEEISDEPITFYADSLHIYSSLYSAVLFFGEQMEEREPILRSRIKVSPQMLKAIAVLATKHVKDYENAIGPIELPPQVYDAWEITSDE
ncbi:MAG: hypothetical protein CL884_01825 [Dehalococcoidia bacterium]|jgi:hypothetical protein|nr:hypothetical protein [Dehalococcoidia bacterium]MQG08173.1 hypothetical protein [SAR202 cluster bacterium]CAI8285736.1 MAG: Uncharacterised protein [Chloroflexota bacterium]MCH2528278.1 DUF3467 domain-containing protein [Dehalococcoidia bacterium]MQG17124.1 hypothetical protein [SAR202 cluster bacterium]|tara:strand:- start:9287 stop:9637 length:351 start_codon:yes stop_codon:yes gene_type:complete